MKKRVKNFVNNWLHQFFIVADLEARIKSSYWM